MSWQAPTANIAGKKITLAWVAASPADLAAIEALVPKPAAGQELDPSQLPKSIPGTVGLKPEIRVDGVVVASGPGFKAGDEPILGHSDVWDNVCWAEYGYRAFTAFAVGEER